MNSGFAAGLKKRERGENEREQIEVFHNEFPFLSITGELQNFI